MCGQLRRKKKGREHRNDDRADHFRTTDRLCVDATLAVAIIGAISITSGFLVGAVTADRTIVIITIGTMFVIIGAGLLFTVSLLTRRPVSSAEPDM